LGWRLSSANQRKIQIDSQGIVCRGKPRLATGFPIITHQQQHLPGEFRSPTAPPGLRAVVARAWRRGEGARRATAPRGGEQLQPARDCVSRDHGRSSGSPRSIASGSASRSSPQAPIGRSLRRQIPHRAYRANHSRWPASARTELSGCSPTTAVCQSCLP
jgi:hypothetical protein